MNYLLLKNYVSSSLNEIRGELTRDDNFVELLSAISGLMFYKNYISNIEKEVLHYNDDDGWSKNIDFENHNHIETIRDCVNELLKVNKEKLYSLNSNDVFFFNDSTSNEHVKFVLDNISDKFKKNIKENRYGNRFSVLIYRTEDLPFVKKGTSKKYDEKRHELFGEQDIKLHKYTALTFVLSGYEDENYFKARGDYSVMNTIRPVLEKNEPKSYFIDRIRLFFNTSLSDKKTFKTLINKLVVNTYKEEDWNRESIKSYILNSVLDEDSNSFLEQMKRTLNHEMVHHKQYLNTFKITKYDKKYLDTHKRYGLPDVPFRKKMYDDEKKGKYWIPDSRDPHRSELKHEMKPVEFYARISDEWYELKKILDASFKDKSIFFDVKKEKISIKNDIGVNDFINTIFLEFTKNSNWLDYLKKLVKRHSKKAKAYYKKSTKELYRLTVEYVNKVEKELIDLYRTNKEKVLLDIKNNNTHENKIFGITKNYLKKIDSIESIKDLKDLDRDYITFEDDLEINLEKEDYLPTEWSKEDIRIAATSEKYNLSKIKNNQHVKSFWLDSHEGIIAEILFMTDEEYTSSHGHELFKYIKELFNEKHPELSGVLESFY